MKNMIPTNSGLMHIASYRYVVITLVEEATESKGAILLNLSDFPLQKLHSYMERP